MDGRSQHHLTSVWQLRWAALAAQLAMVAFVFVFMGSQLRDLTGPAVLLAIGVISNVAAQPWLGAARPLSERALLGLMGFDILLLTGLLYVCGGAYNPFSFLYLIYVALAPLVLRSAWTWALAGLAAAMFGALFFLEGGGGGHDHHAMVMHLQGMWVAFVITAGFIVYFVHRIMAALGRNEQMVREQQAHLARMDKLASLGTFVAGAAHELGSPLATIAVAAKEMERDLASHRPDAARDARLIREQTERCRAILAQLGEDAGEGLGERSEVVRVDELIERALDGTSDPVAVSCDADVGARTLTVPTRGVLRAFNAVLRNAARAAAPSGATVALATRDDGDNLIVTIEDHGAGMSPELLARVGDPFFTTKAPGEGLGLGLFVTGAILERLGGGLAITSEPGEGTRVAIRIPWERASDPVGVGQRGAA